MQSATADCVIPPLLEAARRFTRRGNYNAAEKLLQEAFMRHGRNVELVAQLAETYIIQGYINKAYALVGHDEFPENSVLTDVLRMFAFFLEPWISGQFTKSIERSEKIRNKYGGTIEPSDTMFMPMNMIRLYHFKCLAHYSIFHHSEGVARMEKSQLDVITTIDQLLKIGDKHNAFKFTVTLLDDGVKREKLEHLLKLDDCPPLIVAKAQYEVANLLDDTRDRHLRNSLQDSARKVFQREHCHAVLDIDIGRAIEELRDCPVEETRIKVESLLIQYRTLSYPNGLKMWLHKLVDIATKFYDLNTQHRLEEELKALSIETGTYLLMLLLKVTNIARFHQSSGHDDLVKTTLLKTYDELKAFDVPYTLGQVGYILTDHFVRLRDVEKALKWASCCVSHWKACPPSTHSMANHQLLRAECLRFKESGSTEYKELELFCETLVETDLSQGLRQEAIQKISQLSWLLYSLNDIPFTQRFCEVQTYLKRIEKILDSITDTDVRLQKAGLLQEQATFCLFHASHRTDVEMETNAIELFRQALELTHDATNRSLSFQLVTIREQMGLAFFACFRKLLLVDRVSSKTYLDAAEECFSVSLTGREAMGTTAQISEDKYWISLVRYEKRVQGWTTSNEVLQSLLDAEAAFDALRIEISISSGINAVKDKQALAGQKHVRDIYRFAFQICVLDCDAAGAWEWTQKAKARSLSDTLGLGCLVSQTLLESIEGNVRAKELYDQEQEMLQHIKCLPPAEAFSATVEMRKIRAQMNTVAPLREMLDLRQGKAVTADELFARWRKLPVGRYTTAVAFIDWFVKGDEEIFIVISQPMMDPFLGRVNKTASDVRTWIEIYLHSADGQRQSIGRSDDHPNQALRELDSLVEFIGDQVDEGVLLVLSPAAPLDAIPMHALRIPNDAEQQLQKPKLLIERNPIVYCSNMTVFLQCCERAASKTNAVDFKASFSAVYEEMSFEAFDELERQAVYDSMHDMALEHNTTAVVGSEVSLNRISADWPDADYIHFHGHCDLSSKDITEQSLVLAPQSAKTDETPHTRVTVKDIFDLRLTAPLVVAMACGSSVQEISAGDEPLGLVTALLCAGAATVIGTLWPVASGTARRFTATFRKQLKALQSKHLSDHLGQRAGPSTVLGVVDLAVTIQQTVLELRKTGPRSTRTPAHWAAFIAHGSVLFRTPDPLAEG